MMPETCFAISIYYWRFPFAQSLSPRGSTQIPSQETAVNPEVILVSLGPPQDHSVRTQMLQKVFSLPSSQCTSTINFTLWDYSLVSGSLWLIPRHSSLISWQESGYWGFKKVSSGYYLLGL